MSWLIWQIVMGRSVFFRSSVGFGPFKIRVGPVGLRSQTETESSIPITGDGSVCHFPVSVGLGPFKIGVGRSVFRSGTEDRPITSANCKQNIFLDNSKLAQSAHVCMNKNNQICFDSDFFCS